MLDQTFLTDFLSSTVIYEYGFYPVTTVRYEAWHIAFDNFVIRIADFEGPTNLLIKVDGSKILP